MSFEQVKAFVKSLGHELKPRSYEDYHFTFPMIEKHLYNAKSPKEFLDALAVLTMIEYSHWADYELCDETFPLTPMILAKCGTLFTCSDSELFNWLYEDSRPFAINDIYEDEFKEAYQSLKE